MSVLIKGMEMPYGCADCGFCGGLILPDGIYCCDCPAEASHGKNITDAINDDTRAEFCPLVEVKKPHGRLIDAYELKTASPRCDNSMDIKIASVRATINHAPTIIEAEGSEK